MPRNDKGKKSPRNDKKREVPRNDMRGMYLSTTKEEVASQRQRGGCHYEPRCNRDVAIP